MNQFVHALAIQERIIAMKKQKYVQVRKISFLILNDLYNIIIAIEFILKIMKQSLFLDVKDSYNYIKSI